MPRSLDFTACCRACATDCWRKLTEGEREWLENNRVPQYYSEFLDCEDYTEIEE